MKNFTKWSRIFGSWTANAEYEVKIPLYGNVKASVYVSQYLSFDSMGNYARDLCSPPCNITGNEICLMSDWDKTGGKPPLETNAFYCQNSTDENAMVQGAEANLYFYFGVNFDAAGDVTDLDTGGWVGPYSLLLPDDDDDPMTTEKTTKIRYVNSPATKYLQRPLDYTLTTSTSDFPRLFGELAVNNTISKQAGDISDPFAENRNTCDNGDAKPILPLVDFRIDENDDIQIDFTFHLFVYPASESLRATFEQWASDPTKPVSGPYCWNGDPTQGFTFDLDYDSSNPNNLLNFNAGCVDDLPCVPDNLKGISYGETAEIHNSQTSTLDLSLILYLIVACVLLSLSSVYMGCRLSRMKNELKIAKLGGSGDDEENDLSTRLVDHAEGVTPSSSDLGSYDRLTDGPE
ncbi:hypothetical protein TrVE_jg10771 [Triparma verrucosa]|uniref:Uncharacterized protein n=1 Tax=Triparma verrucosa TaxID=1606542 RepID=A0A9W7EVI4_9STRA|nr:hypothetical protein TrVE_jg10771 [Triparma verrucosa]